MSWRKNCRRFLIQNKIIIKLSIRFHFQSVKIKIKPPSLDNTNIRPKAVIFINKLKTDAKLFAFGGLAYGAIEILWRRKTHWTMVLTGGACFLSLFKFFSGHEKMPLVKKCCIGSCIITSIEFLCGCIVNLKMKLNVWDYSKAKLNILGQICPFYSMLWGLLCIPVNTICKKINRKTKAISEKAEN